MRLIRKNSVKCLPVLVLLFFASGVAALIYEIVWFQLLELVIGSTAVSLGVLLACFMGGMCLGSAGLARVVKLNHHPLRVYALLETGIGIAGALALFLMPRMSGLYASVGGQGWSGITWRALICTVCILPPTLLMGAALPAIARLVGSTEKGASILGVLYGTNTIGAMCGCLVAGFYLLPVYDLAIATYVAVGINAFVALLALLLAARTDYQKSGEMTIRESEPESSGSRLLYIVIAVSGLCAMAAEVVWTRLLTLLLGASVYAFSIVVAVFLLGLGIGTNAGALLSRRSSNPRRDFGISQILVAGSIAWTAYLLTTVLPYWSHDHSHGRPLSVLLYWPKKRKQNHGPAHH